MHKHINDHRIHTLVALDQENLYYTHETRDTSDTPFPNIITIFRSTPMKNSNPGVLSEVRILYPPRMAGKSGFVHRAVCMGETLLRNAIYRNMNPKEAAEYIRRRCEKGDNIHAKYFKDNYDGMCMYVGRTTTPDDNDACVSIRLYYGIDYLLQRHFENAMYGYGLIHRTRPPHSGTYFDTDKASAYYEAARYLHTQNRDGVRHVSLIHCAPPNLKRLCDSLIDGSVKGDLTGVPVVSIAREAVKEYNELEAKYQSACGQISEYEEENRKLKEKLKEISKLVKSAMPDQEPRDLLKFMANSGRFA